MREIINLISPSSSPRPQQGGPIFIDLTEPVEVLPGVWELPKLGLTDEQKAPLTELAEMLQRLPGKRYRNYTDLGPKSSEMSMRVELPLGFIQFANDVGRCPEAYTRHLTENLELSHAVKNILESLIEPIAQELMKIKVEPEHMQHFFFAFIYVRPGALDQHEHNDVSGDEAEEYRTVSMRVTDHPDQGDTVFKKGDEFVALDTEAKMFNGVAEHFGQGNRNPEHARISLFCTVGKRSLDTNNKANIPFTRQVPMGGFGP